MNKSIFRFGAIMLVASTMITSCREDEVGSEDELGEAVYFISASPQGGGDAILNLTSSVESGRISIANGHEGYNFFNPQKIDDALYVTSEAGFYQKYTMSGNTLKLEKEIPVIEGGNVLRQMGNGTAIFCKSWVESGPVGYDIVDFSSFTVVRSGGFNLPKPSDTLAQNSGAAYPLNGKIYLPYSLYGPATEEYLDTTYVAIFNATTFAFEKVIKDHRVQGLGTTEDLKPYTQGDYIYFLSCLKRNPDQSHAVLRINTTTNEFDKGYYFGLVGIDDFHFYNVHDIGGGKALTLSYDPSITTDFYYEYWLIDVVNKSFTKLDVPAASGLYYRYFLDIPDDKVAMAVNSVNGNYIYTYDKATGAIARGMEYVGGTINELTGPLSK